MHFIWYVCFDGCPGQGYTLIQSHQETIGSFSQSMHIKLYVLMHYIHYQILALIARYFIQMWSKNRTTSHEYLNLINTFYDLYFIPFKQSIWKLFCELYPAISRKILTNKILTKQMKPSNMWFRYLYLWIPLGLFPICHDRARAEAVTTIFCPYFSSETPPHCSIYNFVYILVLFHDFTAIATWHTEFLNRYK